MIWKNSPSARMNDSTEFFINANALKAINIFYFRDVAHLQQDYIKKYKKKLHVNL